MLRRRAAACVLTAAALVILLPLRAGEAQGVAAQSGPGTAAARSAATVDIRFQGDPCAAVTDLKACLADYKAGVITLAKVDLGTRTSENAYKTKWCDWKRRNRFNADFPGAGHRGQAFYLSNKALLDAHPEWFNSADGKQNGRLRIEVPEAVAAYKAWVQKARAGATEPFLSIGVEPEDGRGGNADPLPPAGFAGVASWNHADKWWWLANDVAKDYPENDSRIVVTMYAYGAGATNALAPSFALRRNVYPVIISLQPFGYGESPPAGAHPDVHEQTRQRR
jgi:hypothetical protein